MEKAKIFNSRFCEANIFLKKQKSWIQDFGKLKLEKRQNFEVKIWKAKISKKQES